MPKWFKILRSSFVIPVELQLVLSILRVIHRLWGGDSPASSVLQTGSAVLGLTAGTEPYLARCLHSIYHHILREQEGFAPAMCSAMKTACVFMHGRAFGSFFSLVAATAWSCIFVSFNIWIVNDALLRNKLFSTQTSLDCWSVKEKMKIMSWLPNASSIGN